MLPLSHEPSEQHELEIINSQLVERERELDLLQNQQITI